MTTKIKEIRYYLPITVKDTNVSLILSQARSYSSKRILNKLGELDKVVFKKIILRFIEISLPPLISQGSRG